jgi:hypothetical protein
MNLYAVNQNFGITCAGQNNFKTNHLKIVLCQAFFRPTQSQFRPAVQSGSSTKKRLWRSHFAAGSDDPLQVRHEDALGQRESASSDFTALYKIKVRSGHIWKKGRLADHLDAFKTILSPRTRHRWNLGLCTSKKTGHGMII